MAEEKRSVSVIYEKAKNSDTVPITGAYGGPAPTGTGLVVHFFVEYPSIPNSTELEVEDGKIINAKGGKNISRGDITREIQFTSFMSAKTAITLGEFLIEKARLLTND